MSGFALGELARSQGSGPTVVCVLSWTLQASIRSVSCRAGRSGVGSLPRCWPARPSPHLGQGCLHRVLEGFVLKQPAVPLQCGDFCFPPRRGQGRPRLQWWRRLLPSQEGSGGPGCIGGDVPVPRAQHLVGPQKTVHVAAAAQASRPINNGENCFQSLELWEATPRGAMWHSPLSADFLFRVFHLKVPL